MIQVWYHANCCDGFGAAFAAWLKFCDKAKYVSVAYGEPMPAAEPGDIIYILDFSYPVVDLVTLARRVENVVAPKHWPGRMVVVMDHHKTAAEELTKERLAEAMGEEAVDGPDGVIKVKNLRVQFNQRKSGCVLAWEWFHEDRVPQFFRYLQDRDLWKWKLPHSREVNAAIRSYPMNFRSWVEISGMRFDDWGYRLKWLKTDGAAILRAQAQLVEQMAARSRRMVVDTKARQVREADGKAGGDGVYEVVAANAPVFQSEVCERLLEVYQTVGIAAVYFDTAEGKRVFSLRSRDGVDCSVVAKAMGGGGHAQAAGFTMEA